jgi:hypothetical protein
MCVRISNEAVTYTFSTTKKMDGDIALGDFSKFTVSGSAAAEASASQTKGKGKAQSAVPKPPSAASLRETAGIIKSTAKRNQEDEWLQHKLMRVNQIEKLQALYGKQLGSKHSPSATMSKEELDIMYYEMDSKATELDNPFILKHVWNLAAGVAEYASVYFYPEVDLISTYKFSTVASSPEVFGKIEKELKHLEIKLGIKPLGPEWTVPFFFVNTMLAVSKLNKAQGSMREEAPKEFVDKFQSL